MVWEILYTKIVPKYLSLAVNALFWRPTFIIIIIIRIIIFMITIDDAAYPGVLAVCVTQRLQFKRIKEQALLFFYGMLLPRKKFLISRFIHCF